MSSIKLGVHLPVAGRGASPEAIAKVAEEAERIGLDSVWSWERLMRPTVPIALGGPGGPVMEAPEAFAAVYDPIETLTYVAAHQPNHARDQRAGRTLPEPGHPRAPAGHPRP